MIKRGSVRRTGGGYLVEKLVNEKKMRPKKGRRVTKTT